MADTKISGLSAGSAPSATDLLIAVDVSDTSMAPSGTNKKITANYFVNRASGSVYLTTDADVLSCTLVTTATSFDINPIPSTGSASFLVRLFRDTNTTGTKAVNFYKGNNTTTVVHSISLTDATSFNLSGEDLDFNIRGNTDTALFYVDASTDRIGVGLSSPAYKFDVIGTARISTGVISPTYYGSISSAGSALISSTTHATKGKIYLGATSAFDEVNTRLGIGKVSPVYNLDVSGSMQADILGGTWSALTYVSGWQDYSVAYAGAGYKVVGDFVFLRGLMVRVSGSSANIGTLPVGYRPVKTEIIPIVSNNAFAVITINTSGIITLDVGSPTVWVSLSGVCFSNI